MAQGAIAKLGSRSWPSRLGNDMPAPPPVRLAGALLCRDGRLLLGLRSPCAASFAGLWDVLGGHVEPGETFAQAMCREVQEEAGVQPGVFSEIAHARSGKFDLKIYRVVGWLGGEPRLVGKTAMVHARGSLCVAACL